MNPTSYIRLFSFLLALVFAGCNQKQHHDVPTETKYNLYILNDEIQKEYIIPANNLDTGKLSPVKNGIALTPRISRELVVKNSAFFHLDRKENLFRKYKIRNKQFVSIASLDMPDFAIENFIWENRDTLLLVGLDDATYTIPKYYRISTGNFKVVQNGRLPIQEPFGRFKSTSLGFAQLQNNKLLVSYTYHIYNSPARYTSSDTIYMASMSFPDMTLLAVDKDTRSAYPGGINTVQPYTFTTESGDYYFMSCPGIAMGNTVNKPTGIFKIDRQSDLIDKEYFFNISEQTNNHAYGIWYAGNNKAIIRSERKDIYKSFADHHNTPHFEYYLIDLLSKSTEKLNLPLDKGTRKSSVIIKEDEVYIAIDSSTDGHFIWIYNLKNKSIKKGLQLTGDTDYVLRIDEN